jgi:hypothetical protein
VYFGAIIIIIMNFFFWQANVIVVGRHRKNNSLLLFRDNNSLSFRDNNSLLFRDNNALFHVDNNNKNNVTYASSSTSSADTVEVCPLLYSLQDIKAPYASHAFNVLFASKSCHEIIQYLTREELTYAPNNQTMYPSGYVVIGSEGDAMQCQDHLVIPSLGCKTSIGPIPSCDDKALSTYDTVIIISQYWGEGYFHFFIEGMARLMDVNIGGDEVYVHTNFRSHSIASQMLSLIGSNLKPISGSVRAENAIIPPSTPCGGHPYSKRHIPRLRLSLQNKLIVNPPKHVLLVKRHGSRAIANHDELLRDLLLIFPVIVVHEGSESILDQLQMFSDSFLTIAPHGAGLSNIVAMQEKTSVIEILPNHMNACYAMLAFNLGLFYSPYCKPEFTQDNAVDVNSSYLVKIAKIISRNQW